MANNHRCDLIAVAFKVQSFTVREKRRIPSLNRRKYGDSAGVRFIGASADKRLAAATGGKGIGLVADGEPVGMQPEFLKFCSESTARVRKIDLKKMMVLMR